MTGKLAANPEDGDGKVPGEEGVLQALAEGLQELQGTAMEVSPAEALSPPSSRPHLLCGQPLSARLQWYTPPRRPYSRRELLADRIVNFCGAGLAWLGAPLLGIASFLAADSVLKQCSFWAHGAGSIIMLTCSALYHHWSWDWANSQHLMSLDHVGISAMIMGCYAPVMHQCSCHKVLIFVWVLGLIGWGMEAFKLASGRHSLSGGGTGKWTPFDVVHLVRYLVMGWACVAAFPWMLVAMPTQALVLSGVGGLLYTGGVVIFVRGELEFHMPIWHAMVLVASVCFYLSNLLVLVGRPIHDFNAVPVS